RLYRLGEHLLTQMEDYYRKFYKQMLPAALSAAPVGAAPVSASPSTAPDAPPLDANQQLAERLQALLGMALAVAEHFFDLPDKGTVTDRCRRIEQAGWERIYRDDLKQIEALSPVERGLADRIAEEADLRLWHMRLAESFVSVTGRYVIEKPTAERFAETLMLLWETINRIQGKPTFPRPLVGEQKAQITIGKPISVSDRWDNYQANRRQAVAGLTQDLQNALTEMIR
ncbi:MAG TPA: 1-acyl-sn-glycerol-3-phosphate acyltransferase, partial [Chroococcidiopsis sp.]